MRFPAVVATATAVAIVAPFTSPRVTLAFAPPAYSGKSSPSAFLGRLGRRLPPSSFSRGGAIGAVKTRDSSTSSAFDPLGWSSDDGWDAPRERGRAISPSVAMSRRREPSSSVSSGSSLVPALALVALPDPVRAASLISTGEFNPENFRPICSSSDGFYRFLQGSTRAVVGDAAFAEYGPLIAGGLLRIRLELCVVESFFSEAVGPFIRQNGISWILPWHETVETFLAGTIFSLATTFILVGSTKLIQIIAFYGDLVVGGPCRLLGGFFFDRARGEPVTLDVSLFGFFKTRLVGPPLPSGDNGGAQGEGSGKGDSFDISLVKPRDFPLLVISGSVKAVGETSKIVREFVEALDLFVGRYLVILASGYIILKFIHFKILPNFP